MLCFRLFSENNPAAPLADAVAQLREGQAPKDLYAVEPASFQQIPNAPFAYWVSERIRRLFVELPAFEGEGRTVRQGLATANDFRFVRAAWETPAEKKSAEMRWFPFAKGGSYSPYYADLYLKVNWASDGAECKEYIIQRYPYLNGNAGFVAKNTEYYFKPGITWPMRGLRFSSRVLPAGSIFSVAGKFATSSEIEEVHSIPSIFNSVLFDLFVRQMAGNVVGAQYESGLIARVPVPVEAYKSQSLKKLSAEAWANRRSLQNDIVTSTSFFQPRLLRALGKHNQQ